MDWTACWCAFYASLHPDCRIIAFVCFFMLPWTWSHTVRHCWHGASLVQLQVTLNCVHSAVGHEAYHCTPRNGSECTDRHGLSYTRNQLLCFQAVPLGPTLTSHLRELGIRDHFPRKRSSRGKRQKQRWITVVCCGAAIEPEAKRWLEVLSCDPCPASLLPSPPLSQTPAASFFPGATLPSYMPPPPPSTTSPPPCWFPGASLPSYIPPPPSSTMSSPPPSPSTTSPPSCWFPGVTLPSYGHPPSTTCPPSCSSPGATLPSYRPPPLSATTCPPPFCFPVPPNTLATTRQASVNSDNLVTLTGPHKATSHPTGNGRPAQNSLRLAYFNAQSCRQKASEINDLVVDGDFDILPMMETWLYASGDEAYITEMTPSGYIFHSFPRIGRSGGGIAIMFKSALSDSISMLPLPFNSFESVELRLSNDSSSVSVICLHCPPPSKQNKLSNKMFFEEFPTLVSEYSHARRDLAFIGDFNFHFKDSSSGDVDQLKTLSNDHDLVQLMNMPTHKQGHVLDWVIVRHDTSCLSLETVEDIALSDHSAIYCSVNVRRPTARKRLVTSRNLRAMNSADFQADIKSFAETAGDQCADPGLLDVYDTSLRQVLDRHAPLTTRHVSDHPSAPWMTDGIKAAKRELRQAERQWRDTRLTVHREIYTK